MERKAGDIIHRALTHIARAIMNINKGRFEDFQLWRVARTLVDNRRLNR